MIFAQNCKIETISTCVATFWRARTSYLLENGAKRPSQALSTVTTITKANANNNNNKDGQHFNNVRDFGQRYPYCKAQKVNVAMLYDQSV